MKYTRSPATRRISAAASAVTSAAKPGAPSVCSLARTLIPSPIASTWSTVTAIVLRGLPCGASRNTATADGSRALYGIAKDGMTIKQLHFLSKHHIPSRAMTLDMLLNVLLILFVGSTLSILVAGNLGYIAAHFFALTGFLLLRKDRKNWPRPIKLSWIWLPIAGLLACANLVFIIVGNMYPQLTGYGDLKTTLIGVGVLAISILAYLYRKLVQDKQPFRLREDTPQYQSEPGRDWFSPQHR